jgi:shikimate kinase
VEADGAVSVVAVVGLMGAGKTTVGRRVASRLGWEAIDGDAVLEASTGCTAATLAERDGVTALHALEAEVLLQSLVGDQPRVVMPAASTIEDARCRDALASAFVVWLDAPVDVLASRAEHGDHRPLDDDVAAQLRTQRVERAARFAEVADLTVDTARLGPDAAAERVVREVRAEQA